MADTFDRRCQLGASRRRLEDAIALHGCKRWAGSIYLGGYAIECSLKSLICYMEAKNNFKDTQIFKNGLQGSELHSLTKLSRDLPKLQRAIALDRTNVYRNAWNTVSSLWRNDELRYSEKMGDEIESQRFIQAVKTLHGLLMSQQGETS
ncbi:hypothetical protein [Mastigocoleus testarum]|uniref:HEPN domain-containing protein n=1 Tax=Mastigocoleus testarum BC008 TaxID=371196 RepID=A0A0V7ZZD5_9CYAN|nr:hypothetical protein [Mastigocoleus testarum]KST69923.1 hypothetical protein BC008_05665 [Mastigocoleus testarum BC008]KST69960.1 hypothetical protein BC008_05845 [Mastigocoleus testarum BC008]